MPSAHLKYRIGQLLLNRRAITRTQLQAAISYQQQTACRIGEALVAIGAIDESILKKVLRQQRWLRPCATCFALLSPFSATYAYDPEEHLWHSNHEEMSEYWMLREEEPQHYETDEHAIRMLSTALDLYYGEPKAGEVRYSLSETDNEGYQVEVRVFF